MVPLKKNIAKTTTGTFAIYFALEAYICIYYVVVGRKAPWTVIKRCKMGEVVFEIASF